MKISLAAGAPALTRCDLVVIPAYKGKDGEVALDSAWTALFSTAQRRSLVRHFGGAEKGAGESALLLTGDGEVRVLVVSLGPRRGVGVAALRAFGGRAGRAASTHAGRQAVALLPSAGRGIDDAGRVRAVTEGIALGSYRFDRYRTERRNGERGMRALRVHVGDSSRAARELRAALRAGLDLAAGVNLCRDLGNTPANDLGPVEFAARARSEGRSAGLSVRVLDEKALARAGMGALLGVARGSARPARMIVAEYRPTRGDGRAPLVFVGKAITFDTGGISIKPAARMEEMKFDMCGGGAVLGALSAIGRLKPRRRVVGILACAENMPGGGAIRPGDVLRSASGLTVEVINTDAEGRLVLADGLHHARRFRPGLVVDVATLTGACVVALGHVHTGVFSPDARLAQRIVREAERAGELMWPLPVERVHLDAMRSEVADLKNSGGRWGGASLAAAFLSRFAPQGVPWVHLDVAGTAQADRPHPLGPTGATGAAVSTLVHLAESSFEPSKYNPGNGL